MADTKISALTAATTPLAGTEVLPIVQGGVTKQVSVANLTAGRATSVLDLNASGNVNVLASYAVRLYTTNNSNYCTFYNAGTTSANDIRLNTDAGNLIKATDTALSFPLGATFNNNFTQGTAAKGVNFTANTPAAGMTSQLLNWYEEGTFTVSFVPSTSGTITMSTNTLTYTRIGRTVTINGLVKVSSVSSPVGYLKIESLPYAGATGAQNRTAMSIVGFGLAATMTTSLTATVQGDSTIYVFKYDGAGGVANCAQDIQANSEFFIGGTYIV